MEDKPATTFETRSAASCSGKSSSTSSTSKAAAIARAKAEAAKARVAFAEKEMQMKIERARLDASLDILKMEKEAAAAIAEAEVLEAAADTDGEKRSCKIDLLLKPKDPEERTSEYVLQHSVSHRSLQSMPEMEPISEYGLRYATSMPHQYRVVPAPHINQAKDDNTLLPSNVPTQQAVKVEHRTDQTNTAKGKENDGWIRRGGIHDRNHPPAPHHSTPLAGDPHDSQGMTNFVRFFARRELVSTGLLQFDDRPESFRAWRASFLNAIRGLDLSAGEEMDLLVKWLGHESAGHARRIRAVNVNHPERGLAMVWERLEQCYGSPEAVESALFKRLDAFPTIHNKDPQKLRELGDLLMEVLSAKAEGDLPGLAFLDTSRGVNPIAQKLPYNLQEKWINEGTRYKQQNRVPFPPFLFFVDFVCHQATTRNDPSFDLTTFNTAPSKSDKPSPKQSNQRAPISVHKTEVYYPSNAERTEKKTEEPDRQCPIHRKPHPLQRCRSFRGKSLEDRKAFLKDNGICFRCCASTSHLARNCKVSVKCSECESEGHNTALHPGPPPWIVKTTDPAIEHGGEEQSVPADIAALCTSVCGGDLSGRSCSKICLVKVFKSSRPDRAVSLYAILDDQSNRSLARPEFFDLFKEEGPRSPYSLKTCAGVTETAGRRASDYQIKSLDGQLCLPLPTLIECNQIPNNRSEIPTPDSALHHAHLTSVAHQIPELDHKAPILLLLGRDIIRVHKVREQINGPHDAPYAQRLDLGWVIVGDVCLGNVHKPSIVNTFFTSTLENGRPSLFQPCPNRLLIKERYSDSLSKDLIGGYFRDDTDCDKEENHLGCTVFQRTKDDNKTSLSIEDKAFLKIMEQGLQKDDANYWVAPLPFKSQRRRLPNNRAQALKRLSALKRNFGRKPEMRDHFLSFMEKIFQNDHAEIAPPLKEEEERWYLPTFGVYHPKKPGQIRVVFDSSAQYEGVSLNDVLLTGPDLNNTLLGVLIRFRKESIAVTADIQQMFHSFLVREEDRDFLRFLWFEDNDLHKDIIEYRMKVHVFGNSPSPAVAIYGLKRSAQDGEADFGLDVKQFIDRDFYVDDGLKSLPSEEAAISLLKRTQETLACSNLRLHKIASNSSEVMRAFPSQDYANNLKDLELGTDTLPTQRSLGIIWELETDTFTFQVVDEDKPYTRRGVLSTVNSLYDPLGFVAPVTIQGKAILRELTMEVGDWDSPLPPDKGKLWTAWKDSLKDLESLHIPRTYAPVSLSEAQRRVLCIFCDASIKAIAAVAYIKATDADGERHVGFVLGKAKLAPRPEHTIPRLELCAAVLAVELAELVTSEINVDPDAVHFYTDSKVVLGYIYNETRRFYVYVSNRVQRIRRSTRPEQWHYVPTELNPADYATRAVPAAQLKDTTWLTGPAFLTNHEPSLSKEDISEVADPKLDPEVRPQVSTLSTAASNAQLGSRRFEKFSSWRSLTHAVTRLIHVARLFKKTSALGPSKCKGWHYCQAAYTVEELSKSKDLIIRTVQQENYAAELECLENQEEIPENSTLKKLDPFIDNNGLLRVGGRITEAELEIDEKNPLIIPGNHHITRLLVRHHHEQTRHQGRLFTEGAIRTAGLWIVGMRRQVSSVIYKCVTCRKLRGTFLSQKMANLPADRLSIEPPFTNVGLDVFGPWSILARKTRGGHSNNKRWAVIFTCLSIRAVHFEVIESLDTSSFVNALRRFISIRGPVKHIRSDRGTNFIGACKELKVPSNVDSFRVTRYLAEQGCTWTFNPPHSSHMGGVWERMIGIARRIMDSMFQQERSSKLTHETLATLLAEVAAIINARPLGPISVDPADPMILTPSTLLTQKVGPFSAPSGQFDTKDLYKRHWRQVQVLADVFWNKWRKQYLSTLQTRSKWHSSKPNIDAGSIVLVKDSQAERNEWPMALVTKVFPSKDRKVRSVEIKISKQDGTKLFLRPVTDLVLLLSEEDYKSQ
ncbi:uncharacterized protein LOC134105319 [Pungitius pungitius]|uniref:uncharacterized protein LOC134105319 n=1 Tax=Pungitius pungitius TaxID=134920 RepID=UPI002E0D32CC